MPSFAPVDTNLVRENGKTDSSLPDLQPTKGTQMKLSIAIAAAAIILRFTTPAPGAWFVFTVNPTTGWAAIVAAGHETNACSVSFRVPRGRPAEIYQTAFFENGY